MCATRCGCKNLASNKFPDMLQVPCKFRAVHSALTTTSLTPITQPHQIPSSSNHQIHPSHSLSLRSKNTMYTYTQPHKPHHKHTVI